jgi:hypothetical protein
MLECRPLAEAALTGDRLRWNGPVVRFIKQEVNRGEYTFTEMPGPKGSHAFEATNKAGSHPRLPVQPPDKGRRVLWHG